MQFTGVGLHANKFTCCYRDDNSGQDRKKGAQAFELSDYGTAQFYGALTGQAYVPTEAAITAFCFARPIQPLVKEAVAANTYELKQISLAGKNTGKIDAAPSKCRRFPGNRPYLGLLFRRREYSGCAGYSQPAACAGNKPRGSRTGSALCLRKGCTVIPRKRFLPKSRGE
jgi:hypothetical protein